MRITTILSLLIFISIADISVLAKSDHKNHSNGFFTVADYDPARDPGKDLENTIQRAKAENKRIILQVGGQWCSWCHLLSNTMQKNKSISNLLQDGFLVMKVNISEENDNHDFLAGYPSIEGYPHLYILESDGSLLHSQDTAVLEDAKTKDYNQEAIFAFLNKWTLAPRS